jgi:hypothetical protein
MRALGVTLLLLATATTARAAEFRTTAGERFEDDLASVVAPAGGPVVVVTAGGRRIPLASLKSLTFADRTRRAPAAARVYLVNRDELSGTLGAALPAGAGFQLETEDLGMLNVNLDSTAAVFFGLTAEEEAKLALRHLGWLRGRGDPPTEDMVTLARDGMAHGSIATISGKKVVIDQNNVPFPTPTSDVKMVLAASALPKARAGVRVRLRCVDGSSISGELTGLARGKLALAHLLGPIAVPLDFVLELSVENGDLTYLSDLQPATAVEEFPPGLPRDEIFRWKADREVEDGGPLRLGGKRYEKGLGVHSRSELTYAIAGKYKHFEAVVGLDDTTRYLGDPGMGSVTFRVLLDGKPAKEIPEGLLARRGDAPAELSIDVNGVKKLTLLADYGTYLHVLGRADWADASLR